MSKFYAVKVGRIPGIYRTWQECKTQVLGFSGACYKSFPTKTAAEAFVTQYDSKRQISQTSSTIEIYTDGSHQPSKKYVGYGAYCLYNGKEFKLSGECDIKDYEVSNPTAEFLGFAAVLRTLEDGFDEAKTLAPYQFIFKIDYEGVGRWMSGEWQTRKPYIKRIKEECDDLIAKLKLNYVIEHVKGHSGNYGNEQADKLATSMEHHNNFDELLTHL